MAPGLQFYSAMKPNQTQLCAVLISLVLSVLLAGALGDTARAGSLEWQTDKPAITTQEKQILAAFDRHVKDYLKQRERVKAKLPPLSKDATPEQIDAYQKKSVEALRAMRAGTKPGYIFNPQTAEYIRTIIKTEIPPPDKAEIRQTILEADTKGVPLKVNYPYPETKELTQMPPTLLLKLPQLPKEVKYRYVGRHLLLVDTDNNLIVEYMLDALP
jgi:hypothetical protein